MIKLIDLITLAGVSLRRFKIHCATGNNPTPLEAFFDGKFGEWQEDQNQKNFQCDEIISLIYLSRDRWLFAGVWYILGVREKTSDGRPKFKYLTQEVKGLEHLAGRVVVSFNKKFRQSYIRGEKYIDKLIVAEIRDQKMSVGDFPGYNSVLISHHLLRTIVREELPSWKSPLSNVSGVYVLTDNNNGKIYIGSAYGGEGIWNRWVSYATTGHGGNKELKRLLQTNGYDYIHKHFQFSILEVCDLNTNNGYVIKRESHWKDVLRSIEFGYNEN
jgi:hypothetical protein